MERSALYRPELADPFHRPTQSDKAWITVITLATALFAFTLPWGFVRTGDEGPLESGILLVTAFLMALDLPQSALRAKKADQWRRYRGGWLLLDLTTAAPFLAIAFALTARVSNPALTGIALLGLLKNRKIQHYFIAFRLRALRYANALTITVLLYWAVLTIHWIAAGWLILRGHDPARSSLSNYLDALYWTGTTLTTVGYGDVVPNTDLEKIYSLLTMVAGLGFFGYLVGLLASIWSSRDPGRALFARNVGRLAQAVRATRLPPELQRSIYDYYTYMWRERGWYDEDHFLRELPPTLRSEVAVYMKQDVLQGVELFRGADPSFCREVAEHLEWEVLTPGGFIFREGEEADGMYFIVRGEVEALLSTESRAVRNMGPGDFFGEIALFTDGPRTASVRALEFTEVYRLSKVAFHRVAARYPDAVKPIEAKARWREPDAMQEPD
jgi:voltage-gated potassium channel